MTVKKVKFGLSLMAVGALAPFFYASAKPNVVIFYADDFGWADLRHHNTNSAHFRYTPNLDRMFSEGIELENYITHAVCSPSRAGLLTGKHYANLGQGPETGGTLPNDIRNIAKDFQSAGYETGAFGKWHNGFPNFPEGGNGANVDTDALQWNDLHGEDTLNLTNNIFENYKGWTWGEGVNAYGFDRWVGFYAGGGDHFNHYNDWHHDADWWHDRAYRSDELGYRTDLITTHAMNFIQTNQAKRFFCYVPQEAVHSPIQLKRSDLQEFCGKLDTELGLTGQWNYVKTIKGSYKVNPATGERDDANGVYRTIENTAEIRAAAGEEFATGSIDPSQSHYEPLMYAAYCYTLDKSIGKIVQKVTDIGQFTNTIFVFSSDNGASPDGINLPFRDGKHSLYEGGVHVPSAIWWPGTFDKNTAPYTPASNHYSGLITYLDWYPTLMAMSGNPLLGTNLDGFNCWTDLKNRTECRPDLTDAVYSMWLDYGTVRTKRWKLVYSVSRNMTNLYDLSNDVAEVTNVAAANPTVRDQLIGLYNNWITTNSYSVPFLPMAISDIDFPTPAPSGDVLEIKATQTTAISNPDNNGVFIRVSKGTGWDDATVYIHADDRIEFDMYVCPDSTVSNGCFYTPGNGWNPFYKSNNGMSQNGELLTNVKSAKGVWSRHVVGVGSLCPATMPINFIALRSPTAGYYHYYLDNILVRKSDGGVRSVIWQSSTNTSPLSYRYKNVNYSTLTAAKAVSGFPFSDIQVSTLVYVTPPASTNGIQNPSFEAGTNSWLLATNCLVSSASAKTGSSSLKMSGYSSSSSRQTLPLTIGTTYDISVWINAAGMTAGNVIFDTYDKYDATGQGQFVISAANGGWTKYSGRFTATNTSLTVRMFSSSTFVGTVYFDDVVVEPWTQQLPSPWQTQDVGSVGKTGSAGASGGTFTLIGAGKKINGTSDVFRYLYQVASGDCDIRVKVVSLTNTLSSDARSGVAIRESLNSNARAAGIWVTPTNGIIFTWRTDTGGITSNTVSTGKSAPYWVRLARTGDDFKAYYGTTGTNWTQLGATTTLSMTTNSYIGMGVCSGNTNVLCTNVISNVTATP